MQSTASEHDLKMAYLDHMFAGDSTISNSRFQIRLSDYFDLMAGTSTGSIIATYLATCGTHSLPLMQSLPEPTHELFPGSATALSAIFKVSYLLCWRLRHMAADWDFESRALMQAKGATVFPARTGLWRALGDIGKLALQLRKALYGSNGIDNVLSSALGDSTLKDGIADGTSLIVPAYDLNFRRPLAFFSLAPDAGPSAPGTRMAGVAKLAVTALQGDQSEWYDVLRYGDLTPCSVDFLWGTDIGPTLDRTLDSQRPPPGRRGDFPRASFSRKASPQEEILEEIQKLDLEGGSRSFHSLCFRRA